MMRRTSLILATALAVLSLSACGEGDTGAPTVDNSGPGDEMVKYAAEDAAMNAAVAEAKTSLPLFLARLDAGQIQATDGLKVGFPVDNGHEHIWVNQIARKGDQLTGTLANEPNWMPGLHQGSPVTFAPELVSDWSYEKGGKLWGNYTTRVMVPSLAPEEAEAVKANLSDTPTETTAR
jgi:uncharacterized protein YegJ (DUF2314 family)